MAFQKNSSKMTAAAKPVKEVFDRAKSKPKFALLLLLALPLLILVAYTVHNSISHNRKPTQQAVELKNPRQTSQELAEEATWALRKGDEAGFLDLLNTKIKDPNIVNSQGDSLLLAAATLGYFDAVQWLLAMGADVNMQNYNTRDTAVLRSVYMGYDDITQALVEANANLNLSNNYRQTPMGLAVEKQKGALVNLFLEHGAKAGVDGKTLLRCSTKQNLVGVVAMLKGGVNPNVQNEQGNTPLIISSSLGDSASVQNLLAYQADAAIANKEGDTALIYAARFNHPDTVLLLLSPQKMQYPLDVNTQNQKGETALYWAAAKGYAPVVKILLAYNADKNLKTKEGLSALDIAKKYKRTEVLKLMNMNLNQLKESFNQDQIARQEAANKAKQK